MSVRLCESVLRAIPIPADSSADSSAAHHVGMAYLCIYIWKIYIWARLCTVRPQTYIKWESVSVCEAVLL